MKNRGKIITVLGIVLAAGGAVARTLLNAKKSDIVIYNGISTFRSYMNTVQAVCIAGFAITLLGVILTIASGSTKRAEKKQKEKGVRRSVFARLGDGLGKMLQLEDDEEDDG